MYQCSKCHTAAIVTATKVHRGCKCNAPILANIEAKAQGSGGIKIGGTR